MCERSKLESWARSARVTLWLLSVANLFAVSPVTDFSTYLDSGGTLDQIHAVTLDAAGNVYLTGTAHRGTTTAGDNLDVIVAKFGSAGDVLYAHTFGDAKQDMGFGIAVDETGNVYVAGQFQWTHPYPGDGLVYDMSRVFVAKFDPAGQLVELLPVGRIDGTYVAHATALARDPRTGYLYLTGEVSGNDILDPTRNFPITSSAFRPGMGSSTDGFLAVLDWATHTLVYSTYLGAPGSSVAVDGQGHAYVTGKTLAGIQTTPGVIQPNSVGYWDAFVIKVNPFALEAASLVYATYLGGNRFDEGNAIAVDNEGNAYVVGATQSGMIIGTETNAFPTTAGAFQRRQGGGDCSPPIPGEPPTYGCSDAFLTKLNPTATVLLYSTVLGSVGTDVAKAVAVDQAGRAYLTGNANPLFPVTRQAAQPVAGDGSDGFVALIDTTKSNRLSLVYSSFLGGDAHDQGQAIAVRGAGPSATMLVGGITGSLNFPVHKSVQPIKGAGFDAFITSQTGFEPESNLPPMRTVNLQRTPDHRLAVSWENGTLETAPEPHGPWTESNATSPWTFQPTTGQMFFRVRQ